MWPTSSERTSSTSAALLMWATSLQRAAYHANRNGKSSVGMLDTVGAVVVVADRQHCPHVCQVHVTRASLLDDPRERAEALSVR